MHLLGVRRVLLGGVLGLGFPAGGNLQAPSPKNFRHLNIVLGFAICAFEFKVSLSSSTGCISCQW